LKAGRRDPVAHKRHDPFRNFAVFWALTIQRHRAKLGAMKPKKARVEKASAGTVVGAKYRARCNNLSDSEREKLNDEFLKLYYAGSVPPARSSPLMPMS
jgi:hypothetical protein